MGQELETKKEKMPLIDKALVWFMIAIVIIAYLVFIISFKIINEVGLRPD